MCKYFDFKLYFLVCESNQSLFEWVNKETGGLLYWSFLMDSARELKDQGMEELMSQMKDISKKKSAIREMMIQCKETVKTKLTENDRVYEIINMIETC